MSLGWTWILALTVTCISQAYGNYLVLGPTVFRPDSDYSVEVSIVGASGPVNVQVSLGQKGMTPVASKTVNIANDDANMVTLAIGSSVPDGTYELTVTGSGGLTFTNSTLVALKKMTHMILIQFDKAIYKPNQMVRIRVLSVDPENLSLKKISTYLSISDESGNKLDELKNATSDTGVISWDYQLSDQPPLGTWKVLAKNEGGEFEKTFKVDKYVLPRFEVTVTAIPAFIVRSNPQVTFQVNAKYTYGKAVQGLYKITVAGSSKTAMVTGTEGSHSFVFNTVDLIGKTDSNTHYYGYNSLQAVAEVKETTSDVTLKADPLTLKIFTHPIKISFSEMTSQVFRPGLPVTVHVKVTDAGETRPATEYVGKMVTLTMTISDKSVKKSKPIQSDGTVSTEFDIPAGTNKDLYIELKAQIDGEADLKVTTRLTGYKTLLDAAIVVSLGDNSVQPFVVGNQFTIIVETTKLIPHVAYIMISQGKIVDSMRLNMQNSQRKTHLITATRSMAPKAKLIVYAIYNNGKEQEVLADSLDLDINGIFQNTIRLQFSEREKRVKENVDMTITSDASSDFFVLAVDQSVLLLETGNDLTKQGVKKEIEKFGIEEKMDNDGPFPMPMMGFRGGFIPWPTPNPTGPKSTGALLKVRGLLLMTDTDVKSGGRRKIYYSMAGGRNPPPRGHNGGNVDEASSSNTGGMADLGKARTFFPEAWLWLEGKTDVSGKKTLSQVVPDTITTWVATAFSISPKKGLAITDTATKLTAFKPFFITMTLPYSITKTEIFQLRVTVYNYMKMRTKVTVTLQQSDEFERIQSLADGVQHILTGDGVVDIEVDPNVPKAVIFDIRPIKLGLVSLNVTARPEKTTGELGDVVTRDVLVKPEGIVNMRTSGQTVELDATTRSFDETIYLAFPPADQVVPGSRRIEVKVTGDIMGPAISGLDNLLQVPTGCGEQNMIGMTPNIYVTKYLKSVNRLSSDQKEKAVKNMKTGYQRELQFQRKDGSFSAFGDNDKSGSTWLSAFVLKSFAQARNFLSGDVVIDPNVMHRAFRWVYKRQNTTGLFRSEGFVCHAELMGGAAAGEALTAFVLIAMKDAEYFLQGEQSMPNIKTMADSAIAKAQKKLEDQVDANAITKPYDIAIVAYALTRVNSAKVGVLLNKINGLKKPWEKKDETKKPIPEEGDVVAFGHHCCGPNRAESTDVELWSYILLTYTEKNDIGNGRLIMKWLSKQQNGNGGFMSTQDTVLGLQALSEYAILAGSSGQSDITLKLTIGDAPEEQIRVTDDNKLILQSTVYADSEIKGAIKVSSSVSSVRIVGEGTGLAIVKIDYQYNTKKSYSSPGTDPNFKCEIESVKTLPLNSDTAKLTLCVKCASGVGMTLLSINEPTAFTVANIEALQTSTGVKKVELNQGVVVLYMDEPTVAVCPEIHLMRTQIVMNVQPAALKLSSYYKPGVVQDSMYELPMELQGANICDVCTKGECPDNCPTSGFVPRRLDAFLLAGCICALLSLLFAI
ncbi:CD109 antigen-like isoform X3 [Gigantopelta aegis]|uniref:CD109 antigen-like isoform X3 n=1 Tax=Gigantopelta aegis TaxID=1735272 RepID=UPI001B887E69|nr:CD109 antigen-like isoform X3 [Gigantopelta aegis]